jgi:hypothetical protein
MEQILSTDDQVWTRLYNTNGELNFMDIAEYNVWSVNGRIVNVGVVCSKSTSSRNERARMVLPDLPDRDSHA